MSESEKLEQIGRLAVELSRAKGALAHLVEKLKRAQNAYYKAGANTVGLQLHDGHLELWGTARDEGNTYQDLLGWRELTEVLAEKEKLEAEIADLLDRLRALAPHLS